MYLGMFYTFVLLVFHELGHPQLAVALLSSCLIYFQDMRFLFFFYFLYYFRSKIKSAVNITSKVAKTSLKSYNYHKNSSLCGFQTVAVLA